jgi:hypothetical protein
MTVTFTLTAGSSGTAATSFDISGTTSGGALNTVSIATGVTKAQLLTGHTVSSISETITGGTISSVGCASASSTTWSVIAPTPTPSPTPTVPLGDPLFIFYGNSGTGAGSACLNSNNNNTSYRVRVWTALADADTELMNGHYYYNTDGSPFDGTTHSYWATVSSYGTINSVGKFTYSGNCL